MKILMYGIPAVVVLTIAFFVVRAAWRRLGPGSDSEPQAPQETAFEETVDDADAEGIRHGQIVEELRGLEQSSRPLGDALQTIQMMFGAEHSDNEYLFAARDAGYPLSDLVNYLAERKVDLDRIVILLNVRPERSATDEEIGRWADALFPHIEGSSTYVRVGNLIALLERRLFSEGQIASVPERFGLAGTERAEVMYEYTDLSMVGALQLLKIELPPDELLALWKKHEISFADDDEYRAYREERTFEDAARWLKSLDSDVGSIIASEDVYVDTLDESIETLREIYDFLLTLGYAPLEILSGFEESQMIEFSASAALVELAEDRGVPTEAIAEFLVYDEIDLDDLDEQFRDYGFEVRDRVRILQACIDRIDASEDDEPDEAAVKIAA